MRSAPPAFITLFLATTGCGVATGDGFFGGFSIKSALFTEFANSTSVAGYGSFLFSDGEMTCDDLKTGLESGSFWRETDGQNGVLGTLTFNLAADADSDPWVGVYTVGVTYDYQPDGSSTYRSATTTWFKDDGLYTSDSSGLVIEVEEAGGDSVKGNLWHVWDEFSFDAENCGSYGR